MHKVEKEDAEEDGQGQKVLVVEGEGKGIVKCNPSANTREWQNGKKSRHGLHKKRPSHL